MTRRPRRRGLPVRLVPVPKHVPQNHHVPGTIALAFFTYRGLSR